MGFVETGDYEVVFANGIDFDASATYSRNIGLRFVRCGEREVVEATQGIIAVCDVAQVDFTGLRGVDVDVVLGDSP